MGSFKLGYYLDETSIQIFGPNPNIRTLPSDQFFALRNQGGDIDNVLPLPDGIQTWNNGTINGENVLIGSSNDHLYIIAEPSNLGLTLFDYVYDRENGNRLKMSDNLPTRTLQQTERRNSFMAMNQNMFGGGGAIRPNSDLGALTRKMTMMNSEPAVSGVDSMGIQQPEMTSDGVSGVTDVYRIQRDALANGYVAGYVMASAPAITLSLSSRKGKNQEAVFDVVAKESKPSRCLAVLMAIPARCCRKGGSMATPADIMAGVVDFNARNSEMIYQSFSLTAAISYIAALGGSFAEYAPTVSDERKQWSPEAILAEHPGISYVRVHATKNNSRDNNVTEEFRFSLRSTSSRRSLYTRKNIVCLRALEHMDIKCNTEEDAYRLNESAFGNWRYRKTKTQTMTTLERAYQALPNQIWEKTYTVDGEEVQGIGSVFFMPTQTGQSAAGATVERQDLGYFPWYQTGDLRPSTPTPLKTMVRRVMQEADGKKKKRMVTIPILYKEKPDAKCFQQYAPFVKMIIDQGYISMDKLTSLGGRASKSSSKKAVMTDTQKTSLKNWLRSDAVKDAVRQIQEDAADRDVLMNRA